MNDPLFSLLQVKPASVALGEQPVTLTDPQQAGQFPVLVKPKVDHVDLAGWIKQNKTLLEQKLQQFGGILFRGFALNSVEVFEKTFNEVISSPLSYTNRTSPRTEINKHVYTSTDHPADQHIKMHTESSYAPVFPQKICFFCLIPATTGGETPIADVRRVYESLKPATIEKFREKGVLYVRNMQKGMGLSWQEVYQTEDKRAVESYLENQGIRYEWKGEDHLRINWLRSAIRQHPTTGEWIWFNHAYFYHKNSLDPTLVEVVKEEDLPFTTYYGDGSAIEPEVVQEIEAAFTKNLIVFPWEKGDMLLLDNMLMAHGRMPFTGERKILVSMGEPVQG